MTTFVPFAEFRMSRHCALVTGDGSVKRPVSALRFIPRHCGVPISTPHSSGFASLDVGAFYETIRNETFYRFITGGAQNIGAAITRILLAQAQR